MSGTCPVCFERYHDGPSGMPLAVMCGHTFCTACCESLFKVDSISCPVCRVRTVVPNGIGSLPKIYALIPSEEEPAGSIQETSEVSAGVEGEEEEGEGEGEEKDVVAAPSVSLHMPRTEQPGERSHLLQQQQQQQTHHAPEASCQERTKKLLVGVFKIAVVVLLFFFAVWVIGSYEHDQETQSPPLHDASSAPM